MSLTLMLRGRGNSSNLEDTYADTATHINTKGWGTNQSRGNLDIFRTLLSLLSLQNTLFIFSSLIIVRSLIVIVYRFYLHPLSRFPGPRLAAITQVREFYYAGITGTFPDEIQKMHQTYGPIVRINPWEVSIDDSAFNTGYFGRDKRLSKDPWYYDIGFQNSLVTIIDKNIHKERRSVLSTHFSGPYFQRALPMIEAEISSLCAKMDLCGKNGERVNLSKLYREMGNEVQRNFLIGGGHTSKDYGEGAAVVHRPLIKSVTWIRHIKQLRTLYNYVPNWFYEIVHPLSSFARDHGLEITRLLKEHNDNGKTSEGLIYRLADSATSYRDSGMAPVYEDFMELLWGGREVLGHAMTNVTYHLMANPGCMVKLRAELQEARSTIDFSTASYTELQKLPYLNSVCKESLRLLRGGGFRMHRVNPEPVVYKQWVIPANTPISCCPNFAHNDPNIFSHPSNFYPERWLVEADQELLDRYWKPFGHGSRSCVGRNMALEVLYRATANVFSRYSMQFDGLDAAGCKGEGLLNVFPQRSSIGLNATIEMC